jgi:hypothetical protein
MLSKSTSDKDKEAALRAAVNNHSKITRDAMTGKGVDRHLFVLKRMALAKGVAPSIFTDEG